MTKVEIVEFISTEEDGIEGQEEHNAVLRRLESLLLKAVTEHDGKTEAYRAIARAVAESSNPELILYCGRDAAQQLSSCLTLFPAEVIPRYHALKDQLLECCEAVCRSGELQVFRLSRATAVIALAVPIPRRGRPPEAAVIVVPSHACTVNHLTTIMQLAGAHMVMWRLLHDAKEAESEAKVTAAVLDLLVILEAAPNAKHACQTLVNELKRFLGCDYVAVGLRRKGMCRLQAISGISKCEKESELSQAMEDAMEESILRDAVSLWPARDNTDRHALLAHRRLCSVARVESLIISPLRDEDGETIGACVFYDMKDVAQQDRVLDFIEAAERPLASTLRLLQGVERGRLTQSLHNLGKVVRTHKGIAAIIAIGLALSALALPVTHTIHCDCRVEPVSRRYIVAPYDGTLEKSQVRPGSEVSQGDLLARMDGREIHWELAGLRADRNQASKKRDTALAAQQFAEAQMVKLEMERLELKIRLLEHRENHLVIKSPINGIVITGDLERAEGAPLSIGQTLFEIAPLSQMIVEVAIPEEDIAYVLEELLVEVELGAYPSREWKGRLLQLHPRSEIRESKSVFVAEVRLDNPEGLLRPGMKGRATILGSRRCLGWVLFHKPWESLVAFFRW